MDKSGHITSIVHHIIFASHGVDASVYPATICRNTSPTYCLSYGLLGSHRKADRERR